MSLGVSSTGKEGLYLRVGVVQGKYSVTSLVV